MSKHRRKHRKNNLTTKSVADTMVSFLQSKGIKVMRYDASHTQSVYLKMDYGMCYSIRISDHPGYPWLSYRYNVTKGGNRYVRDKRRYYGLHKADLNQLCRDIIDARNRQMAKMGPFMYQHRMNYYKKYHEHDTDKFWRWAKDLG